MYNLVLSGTFYTLEQLAAFSQTPSTAPVDDSAGANEQTTLVEPSPTTNGQAGLTAKDTPVAPFAAPMLQIAFAGRSNVGKSSLINALAGRKNLAKVSATPGKTASINFYRVDSNQANFRNFYLVDLPGYGYAQRSKEEREKWSRLIAAYLQNTEELCALAVLLDCRLEPQNADLELISYARSIRLPLLPLLTKADKCKQNERAKRQTQWKKILGGQAPILTAAGGSAAQRLGLDEVWQAMAGLTQAGADG